MEAGRAHQAAEATPGDEDATARVNALLGDLLLPAVTADQVRAAAAVCHPGDERDVADLIARQFRPAGDVGGQAHRVRHGHAQGRAADTDQAAFAALGRRALEEVLREFAGLPPSAENLGMFENFMEIFLGSGDGAGPAMLARFEEFMEDFYSPGLPGDVALKVLARAVIDRLRALPVFAERVFDISQLLREEGLYAGARQLARAMASGADGGGDARGELEKIGGRLAGRFITPPSHEQELDEQERLVITLPAGDAEDSEIAGLGGPLAQVIANTLGRTVFLYVPQIGMIMPICPD